VTALLVVGCVVAYALIGSIVYGVCVQIEVDKDMAPWCGIQWPVLLCGMLCWAIGMIGMKLLGSIGSFGCWVVSAAIRLVRRSSLPRARVVKGGKP
jgi:hypothetical protein